MAMSPSLIAQLRRRLMDERVGRSAFSFACVDENATDCNIAITVNGVLTTTTFNARDAVDISVDLFDPRYDTLRKLVDYLGSVKGYELKETEDFLPDHASSDLQVVGSIEILRNACSLRHHLFSDDELLEILDTSCRRHNMQYNPETLPDNESQFVLLLAQAEASRRLAGSAAKRRNLETSAAELLQVANDLEKAYRADVERQRRSIPVPSVDEGEIGHGDVVHGTIRRQSLRTGYMAPISTDGGGMQPPILSEIADADVEDTRIALRWSRDKSLAFWSIEIWRDTISDVQRPPSVLLTSNGPALMNEAAKRVTTAKLVYRTVGARTTRDNIGFSTFVEQAGQIIANFIDAGETYDSGASDMFTATPLEPETTYYYRAYVVSLNYEVTAGNVVSAKTKPLRATFVKPTPVVPTQGGPGTVVTITADNLTDQHTLTFNGKACDLTIVDATHATFVVPTLYNKANKGVSFDIVLTSPSGLKDSAVMSFKYTG